MKTTMQFTIALNNLECAMLRDTINSLLKMRATLNDCHDLRTGEDVVREVNKFPVSDDGLNLLQAIYIDLP